MGLIINLLLTACRVNHAAASLVTFSVFKCCTHTPTHMHPQNVSLSVQLLLFCSTPNVLLHLHSWCKLTESPNGILWTSAHMLLFDGVLLQWDVIYSSVSAQRSTLASLIQAHPIAGNGVYTLMISTFVSWVRHTDCPCSISLLSLVSRHLTEGHLSQLHTHTCPHPHTDACTCAHTQTPVCAHAHIGMYMRTHAQTHVCTCTHRHVHMHTHLWIRN